MTISLESKFGSADIARAVSYTHLSQMEEEVGMDFSHLCGYGNEGWGHLTAGGTPANMEGLWYARNFKSMPLAFAKVIPEVVKGKSECCLLYTSRCV